MPKSQGFAEENPPFEGPSAELRSVEPARLKIDSAGRILIPADMRAAMMVKAGDTVTAKVVHGEFRIVSPDVAVRRAQAIARQVLPPGASLVDELIADRRAEARREADEADEWQAAHGLPPLA
jgi:bifunctional DNA-binding transcriptional regulator/antitoxin component of YhaV-PrlF toxin-antitoxin module